MKKTFYNLMVLVIILALGLTACANQQETAAQDVTPAAPIVSPDTVIAEGKLKPVHATNLSFQARGIVETVNVAIGDRVSAGDELARLSNASQAEAQLALANLELLNAQQALDSLVRTGDANFAQTWTAFMNAQVVRAQAEREWEDLNLENIDDDIEDAKAEVEDLRTELEDAQDEFDKYKDLDKDNTRRKTAGDDLEAAQENFNEAVRKLEDVTRERDSVRAALNAAISAEAEARYQWELSAEGAKADVLAVSKSRLDNAQAQVAAAESVIGNYILTAPFDGIVVDVAVSIGEQVGAESRAVSVADTSSWMVETTDITELEVVDIAVGQAVAVVADALPDVAMKGVVTAVSQSAFTQSGDVVYTVYIIVEEVDPLVKWGMTVEVTFEALD